VASFVEVPLTLVYPAFAGKQLLTVTVPFSVPLSPLQAIEWVAAPSADPETAMTVADGTASAAAVKATATKRRM
jgi:hypothetical protein